MEVERETIIDPDQDYCSICGEVVETENWMQGIPLCKDCWKEDKDKEMKD